MPRKPDAQGGRASPGRTALRRFGAPIVRRGQTRPRATEMVDWEAKATFPVGTTDVALHVLWVRLVEPCPLLVAGVTGTKRARWL